MQTSGEAMGVNVILKQRFEFDATTNLDLGWAAFVEESRKTYEEIIEDLKHPDELHLIKLLAAIKENIPFSEFSKITGLHQFIIKSFFILSQSLIN